MMQTDHTHEASEHQNVHVRYHESGDRDHYHDHRDHHHHDVLHPHDSHHHHHHHAGELHGAKLLWVMLLNGLITVAEFVGGVLSNSLSLLSDAVHNLGDTASLLFAYIANRLGNKRADRRKTFGYKRVEIITAFLNALILIVICLFLFKEAYERFLSPEPIKGGLMLVVAIIGLLANWVSVLILQRDKKKNINVHAAYMHLLGDTLSSVAVIIGGVAILLWDIRWIDPLITVLVGAYIIYHTWGILQEAFNILMQSTPKDMAVDDIVAGIEAIPEIKDVHHLHIWRMTEEQVHFEAHINVKENIDMVRLMEVRRAVEQLLKQHHIHHTTLQIGYDCCAGHNELIVNAPDRTEAEKARELPNH